MKFRFSTILALAAAGVVFSAATAQAVIQAGLNQINYSDREQLATYNNATHTYTATSTIAVGDHLYGVSASSVETNPAAPPLATVFDIVVAKIINPTTGASINPATYTGIAEVLYTTDSATLGSGETGGFLTGSTATTYTLADGTTVNGLGQATNTLDSVWQGSTLHTGVGSQLDTTTQGGGITLASNGAFYNSFGLGSALTDTSANSSWGATGTGYWAADVRYVNGVLTTGTVPFIFGLVSTSQPASNFTGLYNELVPLQSGGEYSGNDGTNIYTNAGVDPNTPDPLAGTIAVGGAGTVIPNPNVNSFAYVGGGHANVNSNAGSAWPTSSADPTWVSPATPEPGTLLIMGMGLAFGLPYLRRRQKVTA